MSELDLINNKKNSKIKEKKKWQIWKLTNSEVAKRRASLRLSEIPEAKRPYYGPNSNKENEDEEEEEDVVAPQQLRMLNKEEEDIVTPQQFRILNNDSQVAKRRASLRSSEVPEAPQSPPPTNNKKENNTEDEEEEDIVTSQTSLHVSTNQQQQQSSISTRFSYVPHSADDIAKVKSTLRIYNKHYLHFVQDENARDNVFVKRHKKMRNSNEILFPKKRLGHLPGVDVGCHFYSRAEMVAVGIHSHWLYGIDYMGKEYSKMDEFKGYKFPLAVAIVCSGQYEDDEDNREEIEYTGQGGNDFHGTKRQIKNQEMSPGNLALKNCMEQSIPVRFIRGIPGDKRFHGDTRFKLYTYDGLYKVDSYLLDVGKSGFAVYKFRLKRLEGQPKLTSNKVQYNKYNSKRMRISSVPKLVSLDITGGQENLPIPVINTIDDTIITGKFVYSPISFKIPSLVPSGFTYTKSIQVPSGMKLPPNAAGCKCNGSCTNSKTCACAKLNGGDFPYVQDSGGRLIEAKDVVFECGPNCGCGPGCINRVFRTLDRGWAVKTKDFIPSGAPICEYIGQLRRQREMDKVDNNEYIFEIDCEQTIKEIGGRERRSGAGSAKPENLAADEKESEPEFCIEAGSVGNVARFINHSCDPNLFVQCVVSSHHDLRLARIILVASDNIPPNQELTYDYGYALDSVVDENGNVQKLTCHCGTSLCRGRLY
ncbi:histone-lysine N-methyltransferase, H3 lysine-9 specific SUVH4 isoform X1 [Tanacetum coccineum]